MGTRRPNLSKKDFATILSIEAQTYRRYEIGDTEPNIASLTRIHEVTGVSLDYLVAGAIADVAASGLKMVRDRGNKADAPHADSDIGSVPR